MIVYFSFSVTLHVLLPGYYQSFFYLASPANEYASVPKMVVVGRCAMFKYLLKKLYFLRGNWRDAQ